MQLNYICRYNSLKILANLSRRICTNIWIQYIIGLRIIIYVSVLYCGTEGGAAAGSARPVGVNFCVMAPNFEMARNLAYFADVINGNTLHTACILSYDVFN